MDDTTGELACHVRILAANRLRLLQPALVTFIDIPHGTLHRWSEPDEALLQDAIRGPAPDRTFGQFLAQCVGQENHRNVRPLGVCDLCRPDSVKPGTGTICKDQINAAAFQRTQEVFLILHAGDGAGDSTGFQVQPNKGSFSGITFQVENPKRGFHQGALAVRARLPFHVGLGLLRSSATAGCVDHIQQVG